MNFMIFHGTDTIHQHVCGNSLELWYYTAVILMVGWLNNPEIAVDAISIW